MAEAKLNFDEATLDKTSDLFHLYDRLYQGMVSANEVDAPAFPSAEDMLVLDSEGNATFDADGNPILDAAKQALAEQMSSDYSDILMKNSAYLFANAIMSVRSGGGAGGTTTTGFVSRGGDSMKGALSAWHGFDAGYNGQKIFEVTVNADNEKWAIIHGNLKVNEDAEIAGALNLGDGITFDKNKVIYYDNGTLKIENPTIGIKGDVSVDGTFKLGDVLINQQGIFWGTKEFYHSGNSNKSDVDWTMRDANVYGDLIVKGDVDISGAFKALQGFTLGALGQKMLYSEVDTIIGDDGDPINTPYTVLESDLHIINGHGIKFDKDYVINVRNSNVVSFSAPGMVLNLGDGDNGKGTEKISLQSDIWDYSNQFRLVSKEGAGYFPNGLKADVAVNGATALETYRVDSSNLGVLFPHQIRFGATDGPAIYRDPATGGLNIQIPYINTEITGSPTEQLQFNTYYAQTTSPFRNLSLPWSATLHFATDGEFFAFDKPAEAEFFAIKSDRYHTRLIEDALFFDDGKFIEGVVDGLRYAGNGYFDGSISSPSFASGFAGYGWAVKDETTNGGFHATFDSLTVRKKMRVYELEVQKNSVTNGSLWVSDSCSGDEVIALN